MTTKPGAPRVLSILASLGTGNPQAERFVRIANGFGGRLRHFVVAGDGNYEALAGIENGVALERVPKFPALSGLPLPGRLQAMARAMLDYHLVLTWGWGAIDAALAHTMFSQVHALPPLIHHEDGSDETGHQRRRLRSKWYRRVGLGKCAGLVVPGELMEGVALVDWQQPIGRVKTIRDGVALDLPGVRRKSDGLGRLLKREGELWLGCFTRFQPGEHFEPLLDGLRETGPEWNLILVGDGPRRAEIEAAARIGDIEHRVHFASGSVAHDRALAFFDLVACAGGPDPLPFAMLEAMARGLAICGVDPGGLGDAVADENRPFLVPASAAAQGAALVTRLAGDSYLRAQAGAANRDRARAERDAKAMLASYRRLYASAMGREAL